jgi:excisionase family DNA binding protein
MPFASAVSQVTPFKPAISTLPMPDLAEFMTTKEAPERLGFHVKSIPQMINKNRLQGIRFGRAWLVSRKSVQDYLDKTQGMSKNDPTRGKDPQD